MMANSLAMWSIDSRLAAALPANRQHPFVLRPKPALLVIVNAPFARALAAQRHAIGRLLNQQLDDSLVVK